MNDDFSEPESVEVKAGEEWLVVTCRQCRKTLLIERVSPEMLDEDGALALPAGTLVATCPHCQSEFSYQSDEIRVETGQQRH
jgi:predicted nucleic-acid-binding Zn-ribbon protein